MILTTLIATPFFCSFVTFLCTRLDNLFIKRLISIFSSIAPLLVWIYFITKFDPSFSGFQFVEEWSSGSIILNSKILGFTVGVDSLSISLIGLNYFLLFTIIFFIREPSSKENLLKISLSLCFSAFAALMFASLELFLIFIAFEASLIPIFFLINIFGGKKRHFASIKFFIYSSFGSLLFFIAVLIISFSIGSSDLRFLFDNSEKINFSLKKICWFLIFFSAAIKVPLPPFHTWLPYAHVQSPTVGSILLSGISIKMGAYIMIRLILAALPDITQQFSFLPMIMGFVAIIYGSMLAFAQNDIKRMIAYSSIAHMGIIVVGIFSNEKFGIIGAIFQMISHGIISPSLFACSAILMQKTKTRNMNEVGGMIKSMPSFAFMFFVLVLASISIPGTSGFIGEYLIIFSATKKAILNSLIIASGMFFSAVYMLNCYRKVFFGSFDDEKKELAISDIGIQESIGIAFFVVIIVYFGLFPNIVLDFISGTFFNIIAYQ